MSNVLLEGKLYLIDNPKKVPFWMVAKKMTNESKIEAFDIIYYYSHQLFLLN